MDSDRIRDKDRISEGQIYRGQEKDRNTVKETQANDMKLN